MKYFFDDYAWKEYQFWEAQDPKTLNKINDLIEDIMRNGNIGIGHPKPLKNMEGCWSRKINKKDRLVYKIENNVVIILKCRNHYGDH